MLGAELAHAQYKKRLLRMTTIYLLFTLVSNGRQTITPRGNFNELQIADLAVWKWKTSYN